MAIDNLDEKTREQLGDFNGFSDLLSKAQELKSSEPQTATPDVEAVSETTAEDSEISPMEAFEQMQAEGTETAEGEENIASGLDSELSLPESNSVDSSDIETLFVKGAEGRKQKVKIDYSNKDAIKQAYIKAAGMRKFQAERDAERKRRVDIQKEYDGLKSDFQKLEEAFEKNGVKGVVSLLSDGNEDVWKAAIDEELSHREYLNNLTPDEKFQLEMAQKEEQYKQQLESERLKREQFQQQIEEREEKTAIQQLESKLHPAFDRYRFAGKLGDEATENMYDEFIWEKVKSRLAEYPDEVELSQAAIDKEFRTVANTFKKNIKMQAEKNTKKVIERKKTETAQRAQVAAKKGLKGSTAQRKILESLKSGNLGGALNIWNQNKS